MGMVVLVEHHGVDIGVMDHVNASFRILLVRKMRMHHSRMVLVLMVRMVLVGVHLGYVFLLLLFYDDVVKGQE
jgi:hypothetical protein